MTKETRGTSALAVSATGATGRQSHDEAGRAASHPYAITLNVGSSSIKFGLFEISGEPQVQASGLIDRIGQQPHLKASLTRDGTSIDKDISGDGASDHASALTTALGLIQEHFPAVWVAAIGHRVVHGGPVYDKPVSLDERIIGELERFVPFAPLHQPHNLAGIRAAQKVFPNALQVACFDTGFHRSHPWVNDVFALPRRYHERGVRRYGFHGLSYDYISGELARIAPQIHAGRVVVAHLGNGASMCAMSGGRSVGSTMGFSVLDGLPMGTRCGQLDPGVLLYLMEQERMNASEISDLLYNHSGLLGLSGISNDMRTLEASGTPEAGQAIDYFVFWIRRELGGLAAVLGGVDALVFTGGIGENSRKVRERVCEGLVWLGIELDRSRNEQNARVISTDLSRARVLVLPTNEESVIARAAASFVESG